MPSLRARHAPPRAAAVLAAAALAAGGCSSSETTPAEKATAATATLLDACAHGDGEAVLALLTPPLRSVVIAAGSTRSGCGRVLGLEAESDVARQLALEEATVETVSVGAQFGTATVAFPDQGQQELELEGLGGSWRIAGRPPDRS